MGTCYIAQEAHSVLWADLEGWDGVGVEVGLREGGYMYTYNWFPSLDRTSPVLQDPPAVQETQAQSLGSGRYSREGNGNLLQYSCLQNFMDRGAWRATVQGFTKTQTQLSNDHYHFIDQQKLTHHCTIIYQ